jgi:alpha-mannosidase
MLPRTPYQQFLPPRIDKTLKRLQEMLWTTAAGPLDVRQSPPSANDVLLANAGGLTFTPVTDVPKRWGRRFDQCWWQVEIPAGEGTPRYLDWRDQGEATVYYNGVAVAGVDPGHKYVRLPDALDAGGTLLIESICARTGIWVHAEEQGVDETGSLFRGAYLATRDDEVWHAFHDAEVLLDLCIAMHKAAYPLDSDIPAGFGYRGLIETVDPRFRKMVDALDRACDAFDNDGPTAMRDVLRVAYDDLPADASMMPVTIVGHGHLDLVWLWPEKSGDFKAVHTFANQLDVQSRYPEMVFNYSQPASYEAVERRTPEVIGRVKDAIADGRWEATGAMYVESDTQIACGEALVRAIELGQAGFETYRGEPSKIVWIPDVFGYSGVLPTLMAGFGVPYFYTTKMHWSSATRNPYSSFRWIGNDGSEVLSHLSWHGYNNEARPAELISSTRNHRQAAHHYETIVPVGYGDGGGGVNDAMCERVRRMSDLAGVPRASWGKAEAFFDRMNDVRDRLPAWQGEMYLEYHRGVQTTQAELKRVFRRLESALQAKEAVACVRGTGPIDEHAWKRVVFAQFHDYIPGSSIRQVYDEAVPELTKLGDDVYSAAGEALATGGEACVFNPLPMAREATIDGRRLKLPPLAGVKLADAEVVEAPAVEASTTRLSNGRVDATFNDRGEVEAISFDGKPIPLASPACAVWTFPDHPANYDAWDIDRPTLSNGHLVTASAEASVEGQSVRFVRRFGQSTVAMIYRLDPGEAALRIDAELDWQDKQTLLKLTVPTQYAGRTARYGSPYGSTTRSTTEGPLANDAMFEVPASRWACVSDDGERDGVALLTESKFGFGCFRGLLHVSLIRSAANTGHRGTGGNIHAHTATTFGDIGPHTARLALAAFDADAPLDRQPAALCDDLFQPPIRYEGDPCDAGLLGIDGPPSVVPAWSKPLDGGAWVLRLHETMGRRGVVQLRLADGKTATPVDLRGEPQHEPTTSIGVKPYEVVSVRIG